MVSFIIIIQSDNVIELFAEFAAMGVIAEIDNIAFWFADSGYVGDSIRKDANNVREIQIEDKTIKARILGFLHLRSAMFLILLVVMITSFSFVAYRQDNGHYFKQKYKACDIPREQIRLLGDGICNGGFMNSYQCGFDDGDCIGTLIRMRCHL